ncbi:hypothetical protein BV25DRAFT_1736273 [Artomyces pyxidatus]|uniref:Uncharacterized protein n=1 Tax=Artomyces pyxidatus TaxID=48021 RepID=A0ACB8SGJ6_9AGAM|nr:hypothetical protein BV25DRAFT_1736273 [Artomyces pyxidatus]
MVHNALRLLPNEILLGILEMLHARDLLACNATCLYLRTFIANSVSLQYALELFACGMLESARRAHTLPVTERLKRLQLYTAAWKKLLWTGNVALSHLVGYKPTFSVSGDTLVLLHRGSFVTVDVVSRLCVQRLPSKLRTIDEHHVVHVVPGTLRLSNVKLDSAQGVIIVGEGPLSRPTRTQVRLMSNGELHPLAYLANGGVAATARVHDICGDFLLEADHGPLRQPRLRNWKTGTVETSGMPLDFTSLFFLDRRHIFYMATSGRNLANLAHLSVVPLGPASPAPSSCYTFTLPEFMQYSVTFAYLRTCPLDTEPSPHGYFYSDPADRLISIVLSTMNRDRQDHFIIDVPACTLTRYIAAHPVSPGNPTVTVPWDAWGTDGARVTVLPRITMMGTISGSRRAIVYRRSAPNDAGVLTVLDYSPRRVARALARGSATVLHGAEVDAEHTGSDFGPLRTTLPCIATETPLPGGMAGIGVAAWICENGVLFAQCHPFSGKIIDAWAYTI